MEWYGYILLALWLLTIIGFVVYFIFRPTNKTIVEIKWKLKQSEEKYRELKNKLVKESVEKKNLAKEISQLKLKELEDKYAYDLATLSKREKLAYEKAKTNPEDGILFIRNFIDNK